MDEREMILVDKEEYEELMNDVRFLRCLERFGVDNWEGFGLAREEFSNMGDE